MAKLTIESGSQRGKQFKLPESGAFTIGRDEKCNICIDDKMASRVHCVVRCEQGKRVINDHKSTNGIRVNDVPVDQHTLIPGDTIEIGDMRIRSSEAPWPAMKSRSVLAGAPWEQSTWHVSFHWTGRLP